MKIYEKTVPLLGKLNDGNVKMRAPESRGDILLDYNGNATINHEQLSVSVDGGVMVVRASDMAVYNVAKVLDVTRGGRKIKRKPMLSEPVERIVLTRDEQEEFWAPAELPFAPDSHNTFCRFVAMVACFTQAKQEQAVKAQTPPSLVVEQPLR